MNSFIHPWQERLSRFGCNIDATTPSIGKNVGFKLNAGDQNLDYMIKSNFWTNFLSPFSLPLAFFSASSVKLPALFLIWCFMYERLEQIVTTINLPISAPPPHNPYSSVEKAPPLNKRPFYRPKFKTSASSNKHPLHSPYFVDE